MKTNTYPARPQEEEKSVYLIKKTLPSSGFILFISILLVHYKKLENTILVLWKY